VAIGSSLLALDDPDHAGLAEPGDNLIAAEFAQAVGYECRSAVHIVEQFGVLVDVPAPGLNVGLQVRDAVHDGHGSLRSVLVVLSSLACSRHPAQHPKRPQKPPNWHP